MSGEYSTKTNIYGMGLVLVCVPYFLQMKLVLVCSSGRMKNSLEICLVTAPLLFYLNSIPEAKVLILIQSTVVCSNAPSRPNNRPRLRIPSHWQRQRPHLRPPPRTSSDKIQPYLRNNDPQLSPRKTLQPSLPQRTNKDH